MVCVGVQERRECVYGVCRGTGKKGVCLWCVGVQGRRECESVSLVCVCV